MLASLYNGNVHVWNHETQVRALLSPSPPPPLSQHPFSTSRSADFGEVL